VPTARTVLLATDADWVRDEVEAALADDDTGIVRVRTGAEVIDTVAAWRRAWPCASRKGPVASTRSRC
jgi:hypothetical protein